MRYEHKTTFEGKAVMRMADRYVREELERSQVDGWECVTVVPICGKGGATEGFMIVMKRPVAP